jgi:DNA topoisomerase-1
MVNNYIREISEGDFTAKDFRTWAGSLQALPAFREVGDYTTTSGMNRNIAAALDIVAAKLGNTRAVCKKYYVHPVIISMYQEKRLDRYLKELDTSDMSKDEEGYSNEERVLLKILRSPVV